MCALLCMHTVHVYETLCVHVRFCTVCVGEGWMCVVMFNCTSAHRKRVELPVCCCVHVCWLLGTQWSCFSLVYGLCEQWCIFVGQAENVRELFKWIV